MKEGIASFSRAHVPSFIFFNFSIFLPMNDTKHALKPPLPLHPIHQYLPNFAAASYGHYDLANLLLSFPYLVVAVIRCLKSR